MIDPRHWGNSGLIQSVVTKRDNIEILRVVENCLWDFLNQVVFQVQLLHTRQKHWDQSNKSSYSQRHDSLQHFFEFEDLEF